jgi:hypothetical protein
MRFLCFLFLIPLAHLAAQTSAVDSPDLLFDLMKSRPAEFQNILERRDELEIQIIYTQINRNAKNQPEFKSYYFNADSNRYFYPASTVNLPLVLLALEKLNALKVAGLDKNTLMFHDSVYTGQRSIRRDTSSKNGLPSIAHYAKKILIVSDNDAYNALYEFMGQEAINKILSSKGYHISILHRLERPLTPDENRHTEAIRFVRGNGVIYEQPMLVNKDSIVPRQLVKKGVGFISNGGLVNQPFDFTYKNFYSLFDQQSILKAVLFPQSVPARSRFNITEEDRQFVLQHMSQLPRETTYPPYERDTALYDAYCKFLMYGKSRQSIPPHIRIFNKVGDAYGYLIDNAYVVDFKHGIEFILSAVINTNTDGIYNDGKYEYNSIGYPFMQNLGQLIYQYELTRPRKRRPDLSALRLNYD